MEDREPTREEVDAATRQLQKALDDFDRDPRAARLMTANDQLGAQLRDMDEEEWEGAVEATIVETGLKEDEVRNWFGRLSGKCDPGDAAWTGKEQE